MNKIFLAVSLMATVMAHASDSLESSASLSQITFADAVRLWQLKNHEIQLANDQVGAAIADQVAASQRPNPQLSVNIAGLDTGASHPPLGNETFSKADMVMRVDQPIERGGKRDLRLRTAESKVNAAKQDFVDARRTGMIALSYSYYDVLLAQEKLRIATENERLFAQTVNANKLRLSSGDIAPADFSRIRVDALRAANDVRQAQNDLRQAQLALAYQIGAESRAEQIHIAGEWPNIIPMLNPQHQNSIDVRPDVRAAMERVQAARLARDAARALQTRDVSIGFQIERNGSNSPSHSVGVGVSVPLFTGYEYQGEIARAETDLQAALDALEAVKSRVRTDMDKSHSDLESAIERVQRFDDDLLAEAGKALDSAEFAYTHGALSVLDLLDARRTYRAVQMDAAVARADYAKALAAWNYSTAVSE